MTRFFGTRWDAPAVDDAVKVPIPIGEVCGMCDEPIEATDSGVFQTFVYTLTEARVRPIHMECNLRSMLGGIGHVTGECSCHGGTGDPDAGLSYRESARRALAYWEQQRGRSMFDRSVTDGR